MDLSIVIVNWNTRELLQECLQSLENNPSGETMDVVVVDNASDDGSAAMVKAEFPNTRLIVNTSNAGFATANNQAIRGATGHYVLLLNSDTAVLRDVLTRSIEYMEEHTDVGVMGCRVLNPDRTMQPTCFMEPTFLNLMLKCTGLHRLSRPAFFGREHMRAWKRDSERDVPVVTGCYMMVRREAIEQVGLLDESFFFCGEETDWCRRFRKAGWKVRFAPVGEIIHHGNASGLHYEHRRDVMLTAGLVRFHRKHHGVAGAGLAWAMLYSFNLSRFIGWHIVAVVTSRVRAKRRSTHFRRVLACFGEVWPSDPSRVPAL